MQPSYIPLPSGDNQECVTWYEIIHYTVIGIWWQRKTSLTDVLLLYSPCPPTLPLHMFTCFSSQRWPTMETPDLLRPEGIQHLKYPDNRNIWILKIVLYTICFKGSGKHLHLFIVLMWGMVKNKVYTKQQINFKLKPYLSVMHEEVNWCTMNEVTYCASRQIFTGNLTQCTNVKPVLDLRSWCNLCRVHN